MAGLYMTPWPLTVALTAPFAGRLADCVSPAWLCALGGLFLAIGLGAVALWPLKGSPLPLVPFTMLCGLGSAFFNVANNRNMFLSAPSARCGAEGGMQGTARLFGQTAGAVVVSLLFTLTSADPAPQIGLGIGAALTLVAGLVSTLRVRLNRFGVINQRFVVVERDDAHLIRREPEREVARVMFDEKADEPLVRAERRAMDA